MQREHSVGLIISMKEFSIDPMKKNGPRAKFLTVDEPINTATMNHHVLSTNPNAPSHGLKDYEATIRYITKQYSIRRNRIIEVLNQGHVFTLPRSRELPFLDPRMEGVQAEPLGRLPEPTVNGKAGHHRIKQIRQHASTYL